MGIMTDEIIKKQGDLIREMREFILEIRQASNSGHDRLVCARLNEPRTSHWVSEGLKREIGVSLPETPTILQKAPSRSPAPERGKTYRHYKGGLYRVVGTAMLESNLDTLVLYVDARAAADDPFQVVWARPLTSWREYVGDVPRFAEVSE